MRLSPSRLVSIRTPRPLRADMSYPVRELLMLFSSKENRWLMDWCLRSPFRSGRPMLSLTAE